MNYVFHEKSKIIISLIFSAEPKYKNTFSVTFVTKMGFYKCYFRGYKYYQE